MPAPALEAISSDLHITSEVLRQMLLSIFMLGYAIGSIVWPVLADYLGRAATIRFGITIFMAFNIGCGFATSQEMLIGFRIASGIGGAVALSVGAAMVADLSASSSRNIYEIVYGTVSAVAVALGPVLSAWVTQRLSWKWIFWIVAIASFMAFVEAQVGLRETHSEVILRWRAERYRRERGDYRYHAAFADNQWWPRTSWAVLRRSKKTYAQAIQLLPYEPTALFVILCNAVIYGTQYAVLLVLAHIMQDTYGQGVGTSGLIYLALAAGGLVGAVLLEKATCLVYGLLMSKETLGRHHLPGIFGDLVDKICEKLVKIRRKQRWRETVFLLFSGAYVLLILGGLFGSGWIAQRHDTWPSLIPTLIIFATGTTGIQNALSYFLEVSFPAYARSAIAVTGISKYIFGFALPLAVPATVRRWGYGGTSIFPAVAIAILWGATVLTLWLTSDVGYDHSRFRREPDDKSLPGVRRDDMEMMEDVSATGLRRTSGSASSMEDPWLFDRRIAV
jgi:MFS family permease